MAEPKDYYHHIREQRDLFKSIRNSSTPVAINRVPLDYKLIYDSLASKVNNYEDCWLDLLIEILFNFVEDETDSEKIFTRTAINSLRDELSRSPSLSSVFDTYWQEQGLKIKWRDMLKARESSLA